MYHHFKLSQLVWMAVNPAFDISSESSLDQSDKRPDLEQFREIDELSGEDVPEETGRIIDQDQLGKPLAFNNDSFRGNHHFCGVTFTKSGGFSHHHSERCIHFRTRRRPRWFSPSQICCLSFKQSNCPKLDCCLRAPSCWFSNLSSGYSRI